MVRGTSRSGGNEPPVRQRRVDSGRRWQWGWEVDAAERAGRRRVADDGRSTTRRQHDLVGTVRDALGRVLLAPGSLADSRLDCRGPLCGGLAAVAARRAVALPRAGGG